MKTLAYIFLLLVCCGATFADIPVITASGNTTSFHTLQEAAVNGLQQANTHQGIEYGGVIYKLGESYYATNPVTLNEKEAVSFKVRLTKGAKIVGLFHTHPSGQNSEQFSGCDIAMAESLNVPSYIVVQETKKIEVFVPHVDHKTLAYEPPPSSSQYISQGHTIGAIT